jgi:thioredoxin-like negative regulator of GroEL
MISRRLVLAVALLFSVPAFAGEMTFTADALSAAQAANKPILVEISAPWCPTCKAQAPIIQSLSKEEKFRELLILKVDFDSQKDVVRALGANSQSTLIAFKGANEVGRSVGDTDAASITSMVEKAL